MVSIHPVPLVVVEGFLSSAGHLVWGNFEEHSNYACQSNGERARRTIFASVGLVSSLHDRACELFYSLVGGTVDYGTNHSKQNGHDRFGRTYETGLYPEWSSAHPLHFLGHSMGGPTIMKLQWLIATGFFGNKYHPDMLLSVSTVSSPFRGTQFVYSLGEDIRNAPDVRPLSIGSMLAKGVHVLSYLSPLLPKYLDLHVEARRLSFYDASFKSFLRQLWKSDWAESRDATPFDVTFNAVDDREAAGEGSVNPNTYYRSYCATLRNTRMHFDEPNTTPSSSLLQTAMALPFHLSSRIIASFRFSSLRPVPSFLESASSSKLESDDGVIVEDGLIDVDDTSGRYLADSLRANDGVVPLFSQWHPYECRFIRCRHFSHTDNILENTSEKSRYDIPPDAGVWHVHHLDNTHHVSIIPIWLGTASQKAFWKDFGHWLRTIDGVRQYPEAFTSCCASAP